MEILGKSVIWEKEKPDTTGAGRFRNSFTHTVRELASENSC
jgi:hypothetical protein